MRIGSKIKELRVLKGLTQEELADRAELSKGFISQLERDLTSPSIATLVDILQCLGTDLKTFFDDTEDDRVIFKKEDYFEKTDTELNNVIEWIIPNAQKNIMEPIRLTLEPGGSTYPDNPHEGEEFGYVLSGSISIIVGNKRYKAKKGESFIKFACHEESPRSLLNINHFSLSRHKPFGKTIIAGHCHSRLYCIIEAGRKLSLRDINYLSDLHLPRPFHLKLHGTHRMPPLILLH